MRGILRLVALVCALVGIGMSGAAGLTASQRMLLFSGGTPSSLAYSCTYTGGALCGSELFTATGLATQFDSTGKLTYRPNNLLLNSAALSTQTVTVQSGVNYVLSIKGTGSITNSGANAATLNGTGASNRVNLAFTASTGSLTLTVTGSVTSARLSAVTYETTMRAVDDVDTTASAYYGPRFDYTYNGTSWVPAGLTIEPVAAINVCKYSSNLSSWTPTNGTVTNNSAATLDPSGLNTATLINPTGGSITSFASPAFAASGSTKYTASAFLKNAGGAGVAAIAFYDATNAALYIARFDLTTGANQFVTAGVTALPSVNVGNGWWRVSASWTSAANTASIIPVVYPYGTAGANPTASDKIYVWGPQDEANYYASSYIPNPSTGTTTRAGETVALTGPANAAVTGQAFSIIIEGSAVNTAQSSGVIFVGGNSAFGVPIYATSDTTARAYDGGNSAVRGPVTSGAGSWAATGRAGFSSNGSGVSIVMGGGTVSTTGTPFAGSPATGAMLGRYSDSNTNAATIRVRSLAIWNSRLPDATLQAKSIVGASYAADDNGLRFAFANDNLPVHWRIAL